MITPSFQFTTAQRPLPPWLRQEPAQPSCPACSYPRRPGKPANRTLRSSRTEQPGYLRFADRHYIANSSSICRGNSQAVYITGNSSFDHLDLSLQVCGVIGAVEVALNAELCQLCNRLINASHNIGPEGAVVCLQDNCNFSNFALAAGALARSNVLAGALRFPCRHSRRSRKRTASQPATERIRWK